MAIITFTSDFGLRDAYVAIVKAAILSKVPDASIVDISHLVKPANIADGAFILASSYREFPKGTIHMVSVDAFGQPGDKFIGVELDGHYFIGTDNGLLSLISTNRPERVVEIGTPEDIIFPAKEVFAENAVKLLQGSTLEQLGKELPEIKRLLGRQVKATRSQISGHVIKVNNRGNLITSIPKRDFDILSKDKNFLIGFGRETAKRINQKSNEVEAGDCYIIFNFMGLLEIGIRHGNAAQLLGLKFDSPVWIKFED